MVNSLWYSFLGILASAALTSGQYNHQPDYNQYNNQQQQQPQQHHQQQQQYYPTNQYDKNQYNPKNTNNNLQYNNQQQYNNAYNREVDFTPKQSPPGNTNVCYQAPDDGYCSDKVSIRFFFDSKKLTCTDFEYRGCPGTGNNFLSRMDCLHTCLLRQADGPIDPERDIEMRMDMAGNSFPGPVRNFLPPPPPPHTNMERSPPQHMEMPPPPHRFHGESQMNIGPQGRSYRPVQRYHGAREMPRWMTVRRMEEGNAPMSMRENHFPEPDFGLGNEFQHSEESLPIEEIGGEMKPAIRLAPVCLERLDTGPCKAMIPRWYYNHDQHQCLPLYYGGCKGNNNNFATREHCMHICGVQRSTTEQMTSQPSTEVPLIDNNEENKEPVSVDNVAPAEPKFLKPETTTEPPKGDASGEPEGIETESLWPTFLQMLTQGIFKKGPLPKGVTVVPQTTDEGEHTRAFTSESPKESVTTDSPMVESDEESDTPVIENDDEEYRPILGEDIPGEEGRPEYIGDMEESPDSIGDADYANEEDDVDVPNSEDRRVLRTREMEPKGIFTTMSTPRDEEDKPFVWPVIRVYLNKKQLQKKYFSIPRPLFKMGREEEREAPEQMKYNRNSFPMFRKGRKNFNKQKNNKGITLMQFFVHKNRFGQQPYRRPTFFHPPMSLYQRRPYSWRMERPTAHVPFIQERYGMFGAQSHRPTFREVLSPLARPTFNFGLPIMPRAQISIQKIVEIKPHINQGYGQEPKLAFPGIVQAAGERDMADTPQATVKYGEPNLACLIPKEVGYCPGQFPQPKWYFNLNKHRCEIFFYGGCGGNLNRFNSYDECKATCLVTTPNPRFGMETTGPATMSLSASSTVYSSSPSTELDRAATSSTDAPWTTTTEQAVAETTEQVPGMIEEVSDEATLPSRVEVIEKIRTGVKEEVTLTEEEASRPIKHEEVRISRLHIDGAVEFGTIIAILVLGAIALLILLVLCGIYVARKYKKREKKEKTKKETIVEAVLRAHMFGTFPSLPIKEPPPPSPPSSTV